MGLGAALVGRTSGPCHGGAAIEGLGQGRGWLALVLQSRLLSVLPICLLLARAGARLPEGRVAG